MATARLDGLSQEGIAMRNVVFCVLRPLGAIDILERVWAPRGAGAFAEAGR